MNAQQILLLISGAKQVLKVAVEEGQRLLSSGEASAEDQEALIKERDSIIDGTAFEGPEWKLSTETTPPPQPPG